VKKYWGKKSKKSILSSNGIMCTIPRLCLGVLLLLAIASVPTSGVNVADLSESDAFLEVRNSARYALPLHRMVSEVAFDAVQSRRKETRQSDSISTILDNVVSPRKDAGMLEKLRHLFRTKPDLLATKMVLNIGNSLDFIFGRRREAQAVLTKAKDYGELLDRVNLRLGTTYPDVPTNGNEPCSDGDSLSSIALKLFSGRHVLSASISGAKRFADTHYGDKQLWHSMIDPSSNVDVTNEYVVKQIKVFMKQLYTESRKAPPEHRFWYYGRMLHTIQDSYSDAHVARDLTSPGAPVHFFQNYARQDGDKHALADSSLREDRVAITEHPDSKYSKVRAEIRPRKARLYALAMRASVEFLDLVWEDSPENENNKDVWPEIEKLLDEVYQFSSPDWLHAATGGALPIYSKHGNGFGRPLHLMGYGFKISNPFKVSDTATTKKRSAAGFVEVTIVKVVAIGLPSGDMIGHNDPFLSIGIGHSVPFTTGVGDHETVTSDGSEESKFTWKLDHAAETPQGQAITFAVYDSDSVLSVAKTHNSDFLGAGSIKPRAFVSQPLLRDSNSNHVGGVATMSIELKRRNGKPAGTLFVTGSAVILGDVHLRPSINNDFNQYYNQPLSPLNPHRVVDDH
jgi:hypothetical protein